jgi:hypothetical protein
LGDAGLIQFSLRCEFAQCGEIHGSKKKLLEHYKVSHKKELKPCPYEGCNTTVEAFLSLLWHIRKKHDGKNHKLKQEILCGSASGFVFPAPADENSEESYMEADTDIGGPSVISEDGDDSDYDERTSDPILEVGINKEHAANFERGYADFLNRLMCFHFIPLTAIVKVNSEISALVDIAIKTREQTFLGALKDHNIPEDAADSIMESIRSKEDIVADTFKKFQTSKKIQGYLMENFSAVKPKSVKLGEGSFQYMSIVETLKAIRSDRTFQQFEKTRPCEKSGDLLVDIEDGLAFKGSQFFLDNPGALKLVFFVTCFPLTISSFPSHCLSPPVHYDPFKYVDLTIYH